jgi:hypothetical protein
MRRWFDSTSGGALRNGRFAELVLQSKGVVIYELTAGPGTGGGRLFDRCQSLRGQP